MDPERIVKTILRRLLALSGDLGASHWKRGFQRLLRQNIGKGGGGMERTRKVP